MRTTIAFQLSPENRAWLERVAADRNTSQKHVWRVQIVLLSSDGVGTMGIMRRTAQSKPTVWRWQERFAAEGFGGLLRDKTHPLRKAPLAASVIQQVVTKTTRERPSKATPWSAGDGQRGRHRCQFGANLVHGSSSWASSGKLA